MSDVSQGPGWWEASDHKWYPPEAVPGTAPPPPIAGTPSAGAPYPGASGPYPSAPYGIPQGSYPGMGVAPSTNGLAIASFVLSLLWILGLGSLLAVILGISSRRQIRESRGTQGGDGLALAGLIIGFIGLIGSVLSVILIVVVGTTVRSGITTFSSAEQAVQQCETDVAIFETAMESYRAQIGSYPPAGNGSVLATTTRLPNGNLVGPYLRQLPSTSNYTIWTNGQGAVFVYPPSQTTAPTSFSPTNSANGGACNAFAS
jgi:type II secretory pathway pseudopilin PulG